MANAAMATATAAPWPPSARRIAALLPLFVVAIGLFALSLGRTTEVNNEYDRYPEIAEALLQGKVAYNPFHPYGYPFLIALTIALTGASALVAGCLVSSLAGVGLVWAVGRLAEHMRPGAGAVARWCAAANGLLWTFATTAASDLTAVAATTMACAVVAGPVAAWTPRRLAGAGALLGLGMSARHPATMVFLLVGAWCLWQRPRPGTAVAMGLGCLCAWLPHGVLNTIATGSPLHSDCWHALYLKVCCGDDMERLQEVYAQGTLPTFAGFLARSGGDILAMGCTDLHDAVRTGLSGVVLGTEAVPTWAAWWPFALALVFVLGLARDRRLASLLALVTVAMVTLASFAFHTAPVRHLLPALPVAILGPALGMAALMERTIVGLGVLLGWLIALGSTGLTTLQHHLDDEPRHEVEVARALPARYARPIAVLATYRLLDCYVSYQCWSLNTYQLGTEDGPWSDLRARMQHVGADLFLAGRRSSPPVFDAVTAGAPPPDFKVVHRDADVVALELTLPQPAWIAHFAVDASARHVGAPCTLDLQLSDDAALQQIVSAGAAVRTPDGEQQVVDLPCSGPRHYRRTFTLAAMGTWVVQPVVLLRDGGVLRGAPVDLPVQ
jgi:hypothetical protein